MVLLHLCDRNLRTKIGMAWPTECKWKTTKAENAHKVTYTSTANNNKRKKKQWKELQIRRQSDKDKETEKTPNQLPKGVSVEL